MLDLMQQIEQQVEAQATLDQFLDALYAQPPDTRRRLLEQVNALAIANSGRPIFEEALIQSVVEDTTE